MHKSICHTLYRAALVVVPCAPVLMLPVAHAQEQDAASATVIISGAKVPVVRKLDKTVYDAAGMPRAANGTAQDVLQSTPELSVSPDGKISVKGNSQVTVLIDGKPTAVTSGSGDETAVALQTMSGADIASVEVITNPSAAYNANGGAIVNIVLKRNRKPGAHAQLQSSASDHGLWNTSASGDLTRDKLSLHGNLGYRQDGNLKIRESVVGWTDPVDGRTSQTRQSSEVFVHRVVESSALGADYALSDADSVGVQARYNRRRSRPLYDVLNEVSNDLGASAYHRISDGPNEQSDKSLALNYQHQANGAVLKATAQHSQTIGLIDKSYRDVYVAPMLATDYSRGVTRPTRHLNQATLDWSGLAKGFGQLGVGLDFQHKVDDMVNYQASIDPASGVELPDPNTSNAYGVTTTLSAAYLTDKIRYDKWEVLLGGRLERIGLQVNPALDMAGTKHWQAFNPSLHMRFALNDKTDWTLSYRSSLQMPDPRDLNPFTTYIDAQNLSRGNPDLALQRLASWEIGANTEVASLSAGVSAFYRTSTNTVTDARSFNDTVLVTSKENGGRASSAGMTGSLDWSVNPQWKLGLDGGAYQVVLHTPDLSGEVRQDGVAGYLNARAAYTGGAEQLSLDAHLQSSAITPLGRSGTTSNVNLSWKHQVSKTLSLTANFNDMFDGSKRYYQTDAQTFRQRGFDHIVGRRLYVGFSKKFG